MTSTAENDLDYVCARLHGRRSRLAEGARLDAWCVLPSVLELGRARYPGGELGTAPVFQRHAVEDLVRELDVLQASLEGPGADLLRWFLARFQLENIKVLLRCIIKPGSLPLALEHLVTLPPGLALDHQKLLASASVDEFIRSLPAGVLRQNLKEPLRNRPLQHQLFFLEAALDRGYFEELLMRSRRLRHPDAVLISPILLQEVDTFHLMLVVRGKFGYGLEANSLLPLHVGCTAISRERFLSMLAGTDVDDTARLAIGRAIDDLPAEPGPRGAPVPPEGSLLEALVWKRFLRLAIRAFRCSHMELAAVVGYLGIRRVEVANLLTLAEGIAAGGAPEALRLRMLPRTGLGVGL